MASGMCGPIDITAAIATVVIQAKEALESQQGGLPFRLTVKPGLIVREADVQKLEQLGSNLLRTFPQSSRRTTHQVDSFGQLVLYGEAAEREGMVEAATVREIAQAIFGQDEEINDTDDRSVVAGIRRGLEVGQAILIMIYSPKGAVPDDVYDTGALLMHRHKVDVFLPGGSYDDKPRK